MTDGSVGGRRQGRPSRYLHGRVGNLRYTAPASIDGLEAFDLVPVTDPSPTAQMTTLPPQAAFADEEEEPTGVVGTLREMPVSEIVQTLAQSLKDALVEVKPKSGEGGVIGLERGRVVYARTGSLEGERAFYALFSALRGAFRIRYGRTPDARNIERDTTFLLLEGARLYDEQLAAPTPSAPATRTPTGTFTRFFDEAGVQTPPPLPQETQRFMSLQLAEVVDLDDEDVLDTDRTTRERGGRVSDNTRP